MNCSDISFILDDCDISTLEDEPRKAVNAHVATCSDCARDWKLHTRLVTRRLPVLPSDLVEECSALAAAGPAADFRRRKWSRAAMIVGVAVLAAAAATLTFYGLAGSDSAAVAPAPAVSSDPPDRNVVTDTPSPSTSQDVLHAEAKTSPTAANPGDRFSVRLSGLQVDTLNAGDMSDFNIFRAAVIDELRRTPGLVLLLEDSSTSGQTADFEITLGAARRNGELGLRLTVSKSGPDRVVIPIVGFLGRDCASPCSDAARVGEHLSRGVAEMMMPRDAAHQQGLLKELQDFSLAPEKRLEALRGLDQRNIQMVGRAHGRLRTDPSGDSLRDPAIIRAVIDLASVAPDPEQRKEIWIKMRSINSPALIEPLARAAQLDPDISVRTEALATLVADYARDPRSRQALDLVARTDSHPMLRALARRGLSGEATWNNYVLSSLEDTKLSDAQRLEAVLYHLRSSDAAQPLPAHLLDDDAIKALAQVLPGAGSTGTDKHGVTFLLTKLESVRHPAVTSMLLTSIERSDPRFDRRWVTEMLADRLEEPSVRAALEKIAKADPDEQLRQIAAQALKDYE